ncbi:MAG TPA: VWA domain-containing protein [Terriglobia bacterium]|nr:VWA domain-containing protein [Terriglobia bacterium]
MRTPTLVSALTLLVAVAPCQSQKTAAPAATTVQPAAAAASVAKRDPTAGAGVVKLWVLAEGRKRKLVLDLNAGDFQLFVDNRPQRITSFARRSAEPLDLGILIETSRARLYEPERVDWQPYSDLLHRLLRPGDRAFVATFAEQAKLVGGGFTGDLARLDDDLKQAFSTKPTGTTGLYDSIYTLCEERFEGEPGRRALLVVSDSPDNFSYHNRLETLERLQRTGVAVYTVLPWVDRMGAPPFGAVQDAQLFASQTGGLYFLALGGKALPKDVEGVAAALAYTYTLGFAPGGAARDGRYHSIHVKCDRPGVQLHVRQGYYAPGR